MTVVADVGVDLAFGLQRRPASDPWMTTCFSTPYIIRWFFFFRFATTASSHLICAPIGTESERPVAKRSLGFPP